MNDKYVRCGPAPVAMAAALAAWAIGAAAAEIPTGSPDVTLRLDTTLRYNLGMRTEGQDSRILANPTYDESDGKFKRGDIVTDRIDLLEELDLKWKDQFGLRMSGAGWYDNAYDDHKVHSSVPGYATSYDDDTYSGTVKRYVNGPSGELLDAFVWGNFDLGKTPVSLKIGRHANYWGEGLLFGAHAISYSQAPVDGVKAVNSPGIETKEVFLPLGNISGRAQLSSNLSVAAQYFFEWKPTRLPYGGTYFGPADMLFEGPDRLPVSDTGATFERIPSLRPRSSGNWGITAKYNAEAIETNLAAYYREFDDYQPWLAPQVLGASGQYRLVYPRGVRLVGLSAGRVVGPVSVGAELSYRMGGALNASGVSPVDNEGPRGNTVHAILNGIYLLPKTALWDTGNLVAELAYSQLTRVTRHAELFNEIGSAGCTAAATPAAAGSGSVRDGCSTRHYAAAAVDFTPQWLQVLPSWDLELPMTISYGLHGNAASSGGGNEKAGSWSLGARLTFDQRQELSLQYADSFARARYDAAGDAVIGGNGGVGTTDRGWVVFTYKAGF